MEIKTTNSIKGKLYEILSPEWKIIQDIIWYFTEQGFLYQIQAGFRNPLNPAMSADYNFHVLSFCNDLVSISINDKSFKIELNINNITYELKTNDKSLDELIRLITENINKIKESESN